MGEVYRARDTKLDRDVALKVLPEAFTQDPDRLARFEREAKVLASLNHPNIAAIYGLEEAEGIRALVLELAEGPTLADRIAKGPVPLDEALPIAKQIAEALEAAHEAGVIHRDLKPANIKVRDDSTVKVLDFGLAKAFQPDASDVSASMSPTISLTAAATQMGMVIGTAAYMAPEQAKGLPVDKRADIWAFGAVLFEMLTGRKLFDAGDVSEMLASVLVKDPDISSMGNHVPDHVRSLVRRCLVKDRRQRMRDIGDVRLAMEGTFSAVSAASEPAAVFQPRVWQRPAVIAVALVVTLVAGGVGVWGLMRSDPVAPRVERFALPPPLPETLGLSQGRRDIAISPDGTRVVYTATGGNPYQLYVRSVDALTATPLQGLSAPYGPFISPDGAWVGYFDLPIGGGLTLLKVSILGGPPVTICGLESGPLGATWAEDNTIIFGSIAPSGLWRVSANGGDPEELTTPDAGVNHAWPHVLPGGRAVLFTILTGEAVDQAQIALLNLETGEQRVLVSGGSASRYAATGHIVYGISGTLRAVGFDLDLLEVTNPNPVPVLNGVVTKANGAANFDLARDGSLVYMAGLSGAGAGRVAVWVDHQGNSQLLSLPERLHFGPRLSPDGSRLAVQIADSENFDVWVSELARGTLSRLTSNPEFDGSPLWTPDGERVVFQSERDGSLGLYWVAADGTGEAERLLTIDDARLLRPYAWSADGSTLVFEYATTETGRNIGVLSLEGEPTWEPLLDTMADEYSPAISPDGGWIAYSSDETGRPQVYAQRFPELGRKVSISVGLGRHPLWSPDGRTVFHSSLEGMMAVPVEPSSSLQVGSVDLLFQGYVVGDFRQFDLSSDGQQFLVLRSPTTMDDTNAAPEAILVKNWFEELKRLVPTN